MGRGAPKSAPNTAPLALLNFFLRSISCDALYACRCSPGDSLRIRGGFPPRRTSGAYELRASLLEPERSGLEWRALSLGGQHNCACYVYAWLPPLT